MTVGGLILTKNEIGTGYSYEVKGPRDLRIKVNPGWKHDIAMATVCYPDECTSVQSAGSYKGSIESAMNFMRQSIEQEVLQANRKLADFNSKCSEILALLESPNDQSIQPPTEAP